jgi:hypothetical protein
MKDKYTVRDFLVYFLTGLFLLLTLLYKFNNLLLEYFDVSKADIKDNSVITVFLLIPGLYIVGHIIHGFDSVTYKCGRHIWRIRIKKKQTLKKYKIFWLFSILNRILNGNKVAGILNLKEIKSKSFWMQAAKLQNEGKFDKSEYFFLMNDLFKGLTLISFGWTIFYCCHYSKPQLIFSAGLSILFWFRARHFAVVFVQSVSNLYKASLNNTNSEIETNETPNPELNTSS